MTDYDYFIAGAQGLIDFFTLFVVCAFVSVIISVVLVGFGADVEKVEKICDYIVATCFITFLGAFLILA
jgi:hypothetical protein